MSILHQQIVKFSFDLFCHFEKEKSGQSGRRVSTFEKEGLLPLKSQSGWFRNFLKY